MKKAVNIASLPEAEHRRHYFGEFILDVDRGSLLREGEDISLRPKCFEVLSYLVEHPGVLIAKDELITAVWGHVIVTEDSLTQCLIQIRRALGDSSKTIVRTVPRRGYLFDIPVDTQDPSVESGVSAARPVLTQNRRPSRWSVGAFIVLSLAIVATWWGDWSHINEQSGAGLQEAGLLDEPGSLNSNEHIPAAYEEYLKGKFFYDRRGLGDNQRAIDHYQKALDIDPALADAWVGMAGAIGLQTMEQEIPWEEGWEKVKSLVDKALALDSTNPEAHIRLASYYHFTGKQIQFQRHYERALQLGQDNALVQSMAAGFAKRDGKLEDAIELQKSAVALDPLGFVNNVNLGGYLYFAGHYEDAREVWIHAAALSPEHSDQINWLIGLSWIMQEQYARAEPILQLISPGAEKDQGMAIIHLSRGDHDEFNAAVQRLSARTDFDSAFYLAEIFSFQGELDKSFAWLHEATDRILEVDPKMRDKDNFMKLEICPFLAPMRKDSRWADWQASTEKRIIKNKT